MRGEPGEVSSTFNVQSSTLGQGSCSCRVFALHSWGWRGQYGCIRLDASKSECLRPEAAYFLFFLESVLRDGSVQPGATGSNQSGSKLFGQLVGVSMRRMRMVDDDFQKNLGWVIRAEFRVKTAFSCCLNAVKVRVKKIIKTACEIFHDAASSHALRTKLVVKPRDFIPWPGFFVDATN